MSDSESDMDMDPPNIKTGQPPKSNAEKMNLRSQLNEIPKKARDKINKTTKDWNLRNRPSQPGDYYDHLKTLLPEKSPSKSSSSTSPVKQKSKRRRGSTSLSPSNRHRSIDDSNLTSDVAMNNVPASITASASTNAKARVQKPKPIFVQSSFEVIKNALQSTSIQFSSKPLMKIVNSNKSINIQCASLDDKRKLMELLDNKHLLYHTYTEPHLKNSVFVLKGLNVAETEEVKKDLIEAGLTPSSVSTLSKNDKSEVAVYIVAFERNSMNLGVLNRSHNSIGFLRVKWESLLKEKKRPTQCFRCQAWGHAANNCKRTPRCLKCLDNHEQGKCPRTTRDGNAKCVNCEGDHPANARCCAAFISYKNRQNREVRRNFPHHQANSTSRAPPKITQESFPPLPNHSKSSSDEWTANSRLVAARNKPDIPRRPPSKSTRNPSQDFANEELQGQVSASGNSDWQKVSRSRNSRQIPGTMVLPEELFESIPEFHDTCLQWNEFVSKLKSASNHKERIGIMFQFLPLEQIQNAH